jgi:hypothetical protein
MLNVRGIAVDAAEAIVQRLAGQAASKDEVEAAVTSTLAR